MTRAMDRGTAAARAITPPMSTTQPASALCRGGASPVSEAAAWCRVLAGDLVQRSAEAA